MDGDTVVFVADPSLGNILNFNVGENVDLKVPKVSYKEVQSTAAIAVYTMCLEVTVAQHITEPSCNCPIQLSVFNGVRGQCSCL